MQWFQFGEKHRVPAHNCGKKTVGSYALHLECSWLFTGPQGLIVASGDVLAPADETLDYDPAFNWIASMPTAATSG